MTQRLLLCQPPLKAKTWRPDAIITPEAEKALFEVVERLVELSPTIGPDDERVPYHIDLDRDAKAVWERFYNEHAEETHESTGAIRAHWGKLEAYAARLALVLHLVEFVADDDGPTKINVECMTAGIRLARWFGGEARRIYRDVLMVDGKVDTAERDLVAWIERRGGSATVRELRRGPREYRDQSKAEAALDDLAKKGIGVWAIESHDGGKGRPGRRFTLGDGDSGDRNSLNPEKKGFVSPSPPDEKRKPTEFSSGNELDGGLLI